MVHYGTMTATAPDEKPLLALKVYRETARPMFPMVPNIPKRLLTPFRRGGYF